MALTKKPLKKKSARVSAKDDNEKIPFKKRGRALGIVPYILIATAVLLLICSIANIFNLVNGGGPRDHAFGFVGYYLCFAFFGVFGPAAYLIPFVLLNLAIFWKKYVEQNRLALKIILTFVALVVLAAFLHVVIGGGAEEVNFGVLFDMGMEHLGGGILGGYLAFLLVWAMKPVGAAIVLVLALIPVVLFLVGTTPQVWIDKLASFISKKMEQAKANAAKRAEDRAFERAEAKKKAKEDARIAKEEEKKAKAAAAAKKPEADEVKTTEKVKTDNTSITDTKSTAAVEDDEELVLVGASFDDEDDRSEDDYTVTGEIPVAAAPEMHDTFRVDYAAESEDDELSLDFEALEETSEPEMISESDEDSVHFVINDPSDDPAIEYGADEDAFGGALDGDGNYTVDEVTGEIIGAAQPKEVPYVFPPFDLMKQGNTSYAVSEEEIAKNTRILRDTLESFRIKIKDVSCSCGPTVTRYEIKPDAGVRVRQIANLGDDIALGLAKSGVRIEAPIPGKAAVGVEVPNDERKTVFLRNIIESPEFQNHKSKTAACLGSDLSGRPMVFDIEKMPHILIAGTTGSGKSICINSIIMSILYKAKPSEVKLILIDPKKVEFNVYRDIPHLSCKIVSDTFKFNREYCSISNIKYITEWNQYAIYS